MIKLLCLLLSTLVIESSFAIVPTAALTFDTDIVIYNATYSQRAKIEKAEELIKEVIASEEFRSRVLNHTYGGVKKFVDNDGLSNLAIYNKILEGAETLNKIKDNTMDLEIQTYYENSNTVGYTMTGSKRIYMNTKYLNDYTPAQVSRNMMHEWLHKLGFSHAVSYSYSRDYSVPYGIGSIMEDLAEDVEDLTPGSTETPLAAATNLSLTTTSTSLTLKWTAATAPTGIKEYRIYRIPDGSTTAYHQGTTTSLSFTQSLPSSGAKYYVKAVANDGTTINSTQLQYTKVAFLTAPTNLSISKTTSSLTLKWNAATSSAGINEYRIYRILDGSTTAYHQGTTTSLSFTQTLPTRDAIYYVKAIANDGKTISSDKIEYKEVATLTAPANLTLTESTYNVTLKWSAVTSSAGLKQYKIYRRLSSSSTIYLQGTTTNLYYTQSRPSQDATYYVKSEDVEGNTAKSNDVQYYD